MSIQYGLAVSPDVQPIEKSALLARATAYSVAPGCAGHEYSVLSFGVRNPDSPDVWLSDQPLVWYAVYTHPESAALPSQSLKAAPAKCSYSQACTRTCPEGLDVNAMLLRASMEYGVCILCGTCADGCSQDASRFSSSAGR